MANTSAPFGFSPEGTVGGSTPNFRLSKRLIASGNSTAIYFNDLVSPVISAVTGYIQQYPASPGTTAVAGIFRGCKYLSVSQGRTVWSPFWPGSDANGDVTAYVIDDPQAEFIAQAGATAIGLAYLNLNVTVAGQTGGSTLSGQSGMYLTSPANTSTLPFTIVGFVQDPPGANGTDITTAYNLVKVTFNNEIFRAGLTSVS
jgi:hypothetical protein